MSIDNYKEKMEWFDELPSRIIKDGSLFPDTISTCPCGKELRLGLVTMRTTYKCEAWIEEHYKHKDMK